MTSVDQQNSHSEQQPENFTDLTAKNEFVQTVKKFESSFIRVPFEQFRRSFRQEMRIAERELGNLEGMIQKYKLKGQSNPKSDQILREKIEGLREKVMEGRRDSKKYRERFLVRLGLIEEVCERGVWRTWSKGRLFRLLCDFLIRSGKIEMAKDLINQSCGTNKCGDHNSNKQIDTTDIKYSDMVDYELFQEHEEIIKSLKVGDLSLALGWCSDHRGNLKKNGSDLEFKLRRYEFIELLREGKVAEAIRAGQKNFPAWLEGNFGGIRETMALLCWFPYLGKGRKWPNGRMEKYELLMEREKNLREIVERFEMDFNEIYCLSEGIQLIKMVRTGLSVLKTRKCQLDCEVAKGQSQSQSQSKSLDLHAHTTQNSNGECPVCTGPLRPIAQELPYGHYEITRLRCRLSGKQINEDNPPMALPNGQVFSKSSIDGLIAEAAGEGRIKCPISGEYFNVTDIKKCYFL